MPDEPKPEISDAAQKAAEDIRTFPLPTSHSSWRGSVGKFVQAAIDQAVKERTAPLKELIDNACADDPQWDNTPGEHPAFGRGQDNGVRGAVASIEKVLEKGEVSGVSTSKELQAVRERVAEVRRDLEIAHSNVRIHRDAGMRTDADLIGVESKLAEARDALAFYANEMSYDEDGSPGHTGILDGVERWQSDMGREARQALANLDAARKEPNDA